MRFFFSLFFLLFRFSFFAQEYADKNIYLIDSLELNKVSSSDRLILDSCINLYHSETSDTNKVSAVFSIVNLSEDEKIWLNYSIWLNAIISDELRNNRLKSKSKFYNQIKLEVLNNIGYYYLNFSGDLRKSISFFESGLRISLQTYNNEGQVAFFNNLGQVYYILGDIKKSIEYFSKSLEISENLNDEMTSATGYNNLGSIYFQNSDTLKALDFFQKSYQIRKKIGDKEGQSISLNNLAIINRDKGDFTKAIKIFMESLAIRRLTKDKLGIVNSLNTIGEVYLLELEMDSGLIETPNFADSCVLYFNEAIEISVELGDKFNATITYLKLARLNFLKGNFDTAKDFGLRSYNLALENDYADELIEGAFFLSKLYEFKGNDKEALKMYKLHKIMKDSLKNESTLKANIQQQTNYEFRKQKELDDVTHDKELALQLEDKKRQKIIIIAVASGLALVGIFLIFVYRRLQITKKQKVVIESQKKEVEIAHKETERQKVVVEKQKVEVELINEQLEEVSKEISDSINYAEMIQTAVLPSLDISELKNEAFIYFNPKDRVSGDFYWLEQKEEYSGYCVADCTGHGIPGAFISMVGTILLNEIHNSKELNVPNKILDELSRLVRLTLTNKDGYTMKDGMDMSFVLLNNETKMLYFTGANNPVWIVSKDKEKKINKELAVPISDINGKYVFEIKGDKQPIGEYGENIKPFTLNSAQLEEGDSFYLFSDGYVDQFGGDRNKKFKAKPFRELLLSIQEKTMDDQKMILDQNFRDWKGDYEQIDDVTVMGVRV